MAAYIQHISTAVPENEYLQEDMRDTMKELVGETELQRRVIHQIYSRSGIQKRYSVLTDFHPGGRQQLYYNGHGPSPGTGVRNKIYEKHGRALYIQAARDIMRNHTEVKPSEITHLITISCTGFYAPGPDFDIIKSLGLDPGIDRYNLGFMGCYAVIPGLKLAATICQASPGAKVMVIANELCSIHFQTGASTDELISASVFGDGAAGTLVCGHPPDSGPFLQLDDFASCIMPEGETDMAWTIGDNGFKMVLSTYIPEILSNNLDNFLVPVLDQYRIKKEEIGHWAVHPGGRAILDRIEQELDLSENIMEYSRNILSQYGNMSSATLLFVLREILHKAGRNSFGSPAKVMALAFGPGLTIESGLMTLK